MNILHEKSILQRLFASTKSEGSCSKFPSVWQQSIFSYSRIKQVTKHVRDTPFRFGHIF
jgi:hypothetical protein